VTSRVITAVRSEAFSPPMVLPVLAQERSGWVVTTVLPEEISLRVIFAVFSEKGPDGMIFAVLTKELASHVISVNVRGT